VDDKHLEQFPPLSMPPKLLLGPGPGNAHPRVTAALGHPQVGHLDPLFVDLMHKIQELLRYVWQTDNKLTYPVSGTGSAGMEATIANLVERGDVVLVGCNGYFGERLFDMACRHGAEAKKLEKPWGEIFTLEEIKKGIEEYKPVVLALVHAETSTGALQPMEGIGELCREHGCLLVLDTVTSLAGAPLFLDTWGVDAAYSGTQKCLSCPPGLSPFTLSPRAQERLKARKTSVTSWYFDASLITQYWGPDRTYHHTAPISLNYGLYEALRVVAEEGLEESWERHRRNAERLWTGLEEMGLKLHVADPNHRVPSLTTVRVPDHVDAAKVVNYLNDRFNISISGGLGQLKGKILRIGLMGWNSTPQNVDLCLVALKDALPHCNK